MYVPKEPELITKLRVFKNCFERIYDVGVCLLWLASTCWDIINLQRYWFDYALEIYSSFLLIIVLLYSISPKVIPYKIYKSFKIISKIKGRGFLFIIISLIFIKDNNHFHKLSSFVLLFAGVLCFICEILIPTTPEELKKIEQFYEKNINKNNKEININNNIKDNKNNEINKNENNIDEPIEKKVEIKLNNDRVSEEKVPKDISKEILDNQSTNPYDLPDDF